MPYHAARPRNEDVLARAMAAARGGDLGRARRIAQAALASAREPAALHAFLGMVGARGGDLPAAIRHFEAALRDRPGDVTVACNLVAALIVAGRLEEALAVASDDRARGDRSLRIARYRGFVAQSLGHFDLAAAAYEQVAAAVPDDFVTWNNLGNARAALGDHAGSVVALERAMALDMAAPPTRLNLAAALHGADRARDAEQVLRAAARDFPGDARPLHELYVQLKREDRPEEALTAIEQAVGRDATDAGLQLKLGIECGLVDRAADAEHAFRRAIALDPALGDAYLGLAIQYEHHNREDELGPLVAAAETAGVAEGTLAFLRAMHHRRERRFADGLAAILAVPPEIEPQRAAHLRATFLDRLDRHDEAYAAFVEMNRLHEGDASEPLARAARLRGDLARDIGLMTAEWAAGWQPAAPPGDRRDPVFLVGFPRSGTTLLDTILMGHPDTLVLEEKPALNLVDKELGGLAAIATLDEAALRAARARYWEEVAKHAALGDRLLIDKSPLFLSKVPLIRRLFPGARFILALRHPADVVLSCFMANFRLNSAMSNFLRIEDAAAFYDLNFSHWSVAQKLLPMPVHRIVYERLVANTEGELRPLLDYLELAWHADALDHQRTARERGLITTASYSQVTEPIYTRAAGRWRRYAAHLEPVMPVLSPWIARFGYER